MTHRITVGFDGSGPARRAVQWAADEAQRRNACLELVACYSAPPMHDPWFVGVPYHQDQVRADIEHMMEPVADLVRRRRPQLPVETCYVTGHARSELPMCARGAELLVVGCAGAGTGGVEHRLLGSVAVAVARNSPCPVVMVPDVEAPTPAGRVVVGTDGSPASLAALDWAADEADRRDAELVVMHAWRYAYADEPGSRPGRDRMQVDAATVLDRCVERCRERCRSTVRGALVEASPADALVDAAGRADLVVVGSHGRGPLRSRLFGSVARAVAERAQRPTVVVRPGESQ